MVIRPSFLYSVFTVGFLPGNFIDSPTIKFALSARIIMERTQRICRFAVMKFGGISFQLILRTSISALQEQKILV